MFVTIKVSSKGVTMSKEYGVNFVGIVPSYSFGDITRFRTMDEAIEFIDAFDKDYSRRLRVLFEMSEDDEVTRKVYTSKDGFEWFYAIEYSLKRVDDSEPFRKLVVQCFELISSTL